MLKKVLFLMSLMIFFVSCASEEVKETPEPKNENVKEAAPVNNSVVVGQMNSQLEKVPYTGFDYKGYNVPSYKYDKWATAAAPVIQKIIDNMPEGYVFTVKGHTDSVGPEQPEGSKIGNIELSKRRAKAVYDALRRKGITSNKMTYKGVGSSEPKSGVDPKDASQRRVTFEVEKQ